VRANYAPLLEVSTKSEEPVGPRLTSRFHSHLGVMPLEMAFQGSTVFAGAGRFTDIYHAKDSRDAKRGPRLKRNPAP